MAVLQQVTWKLHMVFRELSIMQESSAQGANSQKGKSRCKMVCVLSLFKTCISLVAASFNGADMQALTDCFSSARSVAQLMISMHEHIRIRQQLVP